MSSFSRVIFYQNIFSERIKTPVTKTLRGESYSYSMIIEIKAGF